MGDMIPVSYFFEWAELKRLNFLRRLGEIDVSRHERK